MPGRRRVLGYYSELFQTLFAHSLNERAALPGNILPTLVSRCRALVLDHIAAYMSGSSNSKCPARRTSGAWEGK